FTFSFTALEGEEAEEGAPMGCMVLLVILVDQVFDPETHPLTPAHTRTRRDVM
ncbi:hypothetical protein E3U43_011152, partial [Larimichthys crocea]